MSSLPSAMRPLSSPMTSMPSRILRQTPGRKRLSVTFDGERTFNSLKDLFEMKKNMHQFQFVGQPKSTQKTYLQNGCIFRWKQLLLHTSLMLDGLCPGHLLGWSSKYFLTGGAKKSHSLVLLGWKWCCSTRSTFGNLFPKAVLQNHPSTLNENMMKDERESSILDSRVDYLHRNSSKRMAIGWPCQPLADHWASRRFAWSSYWQSGGWAVSSVRQITPHDVHDAASVTTAKRKRYYGV